MTREDVQEIIDEVFARYEPRRRELLKALNEEMRAAVRREFAARGEGHLVEDAPSSH